MARSPPGHGTDIIPASAGPTVPAMAEREAAPESLFQSIDPHLNLFPLERGMDFTGLLSTRLRFRTAETV